MSPLDNQQSLIIPTNPTNTNTHLKIQLANQFLHNLNNLNTKRSNLDNTHMTKINKRCNRVKIAAYASMASVVGSRRAWSRAILWKIRSRGSLTRNKRWINNKTRRVRVHKLVHLGSSKKRNSRCLNSKREYHVDPFGNSGQEVKLRKLVPGSEKMDACCLLDETADYIKCLATQVEVMRTLVDFYSTI